MDYTIKHIGNGEFKLIFSDTNEIKDAGPNLRGMIRYTYFEDYSLPPIDWEVTNTKLLNDYFPKVSNDISEGKINVGKPENGDSDYIEIIN